MKKKTLIIIIAVVLVVVIAAVAALVAINNKNKGDEDDVSSITSSQTNSEQVVVGGNVELPKVETKPDTEFKVDVKIASNPGFAGYDLEFTFDSKAFSFVKCENALLAPLNVTETGDGTLAVIGVENGNVKGNDTLFTLVFKANKDAAAGDYDLKVTKAEFANWDEVTVKPQISAGKITIK